MSNVRRLVILGRASQLLAVGGDLELLELVRARLSGRSYDVEIHRSTAECLRRFSSHGAELVLVSLPLGQGGGAELLRDLHNIDARLKIVVIGRDEGIRDAADAFRLGAFEYMEEVSGEMVDLLTAIGSALGSRRGDMHLCSIRALGAHGASLSALTGASAP